MVGRSWMVVGHAGTGPDGRSLMGDNGVMSLGVRDRSALDGGAAAHSRRVPGLISGTMTAPQDGSGI
jgi:hypothetical protein